MAPASAAEPLLASAVVTDEELGRLFENVIGGKALLTRKQGLLRTGQRSVDETFGGGLERGNVVGVWGNEGGGGAEICLALFSSALLENPHSSAAVVDTTGNFDVIRLYSFILARLQDDAGMLRALNLAMGVEGVGAEDLAAKALDRVNIMRAFDLVGVMEAVGEVKADLEGLDPQGGEEGVEELSGDGPPAALSLEEVQRDTHTEPEKELHKRTYVADSDDEEEMLFDDEPAFQISTTVPTAEALPMEEQDEILFVDGASDERDSTFHPPPATATTEIQFAGTGQPKSEIDPTSTQPAFLLIEDLAHVISPLLQKDYVQAQSLTSSFLLTLSNLTRNHNLHTLLSNPSVPPRASPKKVNPNQENRQPPPPPPSIFTSNKNVPALMGLISPYLDLSLLVEEMPRRREDARAVYADGEAVKWMRKGVEMVSVVEIMSDRWGGRGGGWGTFVCGERGLRDI